MELSGLKSLIEDSLHICESKLEIEPEIVLSEADFERLVCWALMEKLGHRNYSMPQKGDFTVHTQVSHYFEEGNRGPEYRVDILLLTKEGMENAKHQKEYKYVKDSFALELKYFHSNDSHNKIKRIKCDFCKRGELEQNSWLYVVALIEEDDDETYKIKKGLIDFVGNEEEKGKDNLFHYVMRKKKVNWDKFKESEQ